MPIYSRYNTSPLKNNYAYRSNIMAFAAITKRMSCCQDQDEPVPVRKLRRRGRVGTDFERMRDTVLDKLSIDDCTSSSFYRTGITYGPAPWDSDIIPDNSPMGSNTTDWRSSWIQIPVTSRRGRRLRRRVYQIACEM